MGAHAQGLSSAAGLTYQEIGDVPNGARFSGKLSYSGPPVDPVTIRVSKDSSICGAGFRTIQPFRVAEDGALSEGVIEIRGITRGKPWPKAFDTTKIYQIECSFQPFVQIGKATADAEIFNNDPILHNIHAYEVHKGVRRELFNFSQPNGGQVDFIPLRLRRGHLVTLDCNAHNWMSGWIYTSSTPYISVTSIDGLFEIDGIPPGEYQVVTWHPVLGERTGNLAVNAGDDLVFDIVLS
ncbi:MAG: carboxypeptidase regulatory-like domain-containing protein [Pseudomonadota bacterium]